MLLAFPTVLVVGFVVGLFIGQFSHPHLNSTQVFLWAIGGSCLGAYLGAMGGIRLVILLLPSGGESFSGLVPAIIGWGIGTLVGAVVGGLFNMLLLEKNSPRTRRLQSFVIASILVGVLVVQAAHLYRNYASPADKAQLSRLLQSKKARLVNTFVTEAAQPGNDHHLAISANGQVLASTDGEDIDLWDIQSGQKLRSLPNSGSRVTALALNSTAKALAVGLGSNTVAVYDVMTGQQKYFASDSGTNQYAEIHSLAISSNGQRMASGGRDGAVRLWDLRTGKLIKTLLEPNDNAVQYSVIFSPDNQTVLGVGPSLIKVWQQSDGKPLRTLGTQAASNALLADIALSSDAQTLMIARSGVCYGGGGEGSLEFWDLKTGQQRQAIKPGCSPISSADISHDWQIVVSKDTNNVIQAWNVSTGELIDTFSDGDPIGSPAVAISADGRTVFSSGIHEGNVKLWQLPEN